MVKKFHRDSDVSICSSIGIIPVDKSHQNGLRTTHGPDGFPSGHAKLNVYLNNE
jgi:hypothetical protein